MSNPQSDPYRAYHQETGRCIDPHCSFRQIIHTHASDQAASFERSTSYWVQRIQPWLDEIGREQRILRDRIDAVMHLIEVEVGTLQEQIDEIWTEIRGE